MSEADYTASREACDQADSEADYETGYWADYEADYRALREEAGAVLLERDVLKVSGPDAQSYLDGQLSQDIATLSSAAGEPVWSFILQPTGKVDSYCRVFRSGENEFYLEVPAGHGEAALTRLERFKLRVDCEIELKHWQMQAIRGPNSTSQDGIAVDTGGDTLPSELPARSRSPRPIGRA